MSRKDYTYKKYRQDIDRGIPKPQRYGQYAFNLLWEKRPDLSEQIRGSMRDPFHQDSRCGDFFKWVEEHWNDPTPTDRLVSFFETLIPLLENGEDPNPDQQKIKAIITEAYDLHKLLKEYG